MNALGQISKKYIDATNDGTVDKVEVYTRNPNGDITETKVYLGKTADGLPGSIIRYEYDNNGRVVKNLKDTDANGTYNSIEKVTRDVYGNALKIESDSNGDGTYESAKLYTYDSQGKQLTYVVDKTNNGKTQDDTSYEYEFDSQGRISISHVTTPTSSYDTINHYDGSNRLVRQEFDYKKDGFGVGDAAEVREFNNLDYITKIYRESYEGVKGTITTYDRSANGEVTLSYLDYTHSNPKAGNQLHFGWWGGVNTVNHQEDMTNWSNEKLQKFGKSLSQIQLSDPSYISELTLDKATIEKIAFKPTSGTSLNLRINGDSTDTVTLKHASDFTKADTSNVAGFDKYTYTDSAGETQNLYIDSDIHVVLG